MGDASVKANRLFRAVRRVARSEVWSKETDRRIERCVGPPFAWVWFGVRRPWVVAALCVGAIALASLHTYATASGYGLRFFVRIISMWFCQTLAGFLALVVLGQLLRLRSGLLSPWCITGIAIVFMPLIVLDAFTFASPEVDWAWLVWLISEDANGFSWALSVFIFVGVPPLLAFGMSVADREVEEHRGVGLRSWLGRFSRV